MFNLSKNQSMNIFNRNSNEFDHVDLIETINDAVEKNKSDEKEELRKEIQEIFSEYYETLWEEIRLSKNKDKRDMEFWKNILELVSTINKDVLTCIEESLTIKTNTIMAKLKITVDNADKLVAAAALADCKVEKVWKMGEKESRCEVSFRHASQVWDMRGFFERPLQAKTDVQPQNDEKDGKAK